MSYVPFLLPLNSNYCLHPVNFCEHNPHSRHNKCLLAFILPSFIRYHPVMKRSSDAGVSHWGKCHNFEWNVNISPHICRVTTTNIDVLEFVSPSFLCGMGLKFLTCFFPLWRFIAVGICHVCFAAPFFSVPPVHTSGFVCVQTVLADAMRALVSVLPQPFAFIIWKHTTLTWRHWQQWKEWQTAGLCTVKGG